MSSTPSQPEAGMDGQAITQGDIDNVRHVGNSPACGPHRGGALLDLADRLERQLRSTLPTRSGDAGAVPEWAQEPIAFTRAALVAGRHLPLNDRALAWVSDDRQRLADRVAEMERHRDEQQRAASYYGDLWSTAQGTIADLQSQLTAALQRAEGAEQAIDQALQAMREPCELRDARKGRDILTHYTIWRKRLDKTSTAPVQQEGTV